MTCSLTSCGKKTTDHQGPNPEVATEKTESVLFEETHKELYQAILNNDISKIKKLLENKSQVDLNKLMENGETLMTTAVEKDLYPIVELLIENYASLSATNSKKETPLMVAAKKGFENLLRLLISLGSKPDTKDLNGNTALHLAILNSHESVALFLINSRTNIDITNNDNQSALKLAEVLNLKQVLSLLRSLTQSSVGLPNKSDVRNLFRLGDLESLNQLFIKYPSVSHEYKDLNFYVLIMRSHEHDKALSMTHLLISYGVNIDGPHGSDVTPLIEAVKQDKGYEDFVALLLEENVNHYILDDQGNSALVWAIRNNNSINVRKLIANKALKKYSYYENDKIITIKVCEVARMMKRKNTTSQDKDANNEIISLLSCGLNSLF